MNWNWDPGRWKRSTKVLLAIATIWPVVYIALFFLFIFSMFLILPFQENRSRRTCGDIDLLQLDRKIKNGEIKQLTIRSREIVAIDRVRNCEFQVTVTNETTREEILREAREIDANGQQRVATIQEETSAAAVGFFFPIGIVALFGAHMLTILLIMGLMPLYIVLAVKSDRLDQTTRIIWVVLLCMMGMFAMPAYWYLYVWREPPISPTGGSAAQFPGQGPSGAS